MEKRIKENEQHIKFKAVSIFDYIGDFRINFVALEWNGNGFSGGYIYVGWCFLTIMVKWMNESNCISAHDKKNMYSKSVFTGHRQNIKAPIKNTCFFILFWKMLWVFICVWNEHQSKKIFVKEKTSCTLILDSIYIQVLNYLSIWVMLLLLISIGPEWDHIWWNWRILGFQPVVHLSL